MTRDELNIRVDEAGLCFVVSHEQHEQVRLYLNKRNEWNKTHNLTGPAAAKTPWANDVLDGIALAQLVDTNCPLYDVGTGSGVPGLITAILHPDLNVHLVEPLTKRVAFLKTMVHALGLKQVAVHRSRWPIEVSQPGQVVSRAVVSPEEWPSLANSSSMITSIYRYLARLRPPFLERGFHQVSEVTYHRRIDEQMLLERWDRQ